MSEIRSFSESKELSKEQPSLTVYLIRHGESGKDKTNSKRGLTDKGVEQVKQTTHNIIKQIITDEVPEFANWEDKEAVKNAFKQALQKVEIHLRDSGTVRTQEQEWAEHDVMIEMGANEEDINLPKSAYEWKGVPTPDTAGPGIARRVKGIQGVDTNPEFRKKISDKAYQEKLGAKDEIVAWALTPEDDIPEDVETKAEMVRRKNADLVVVERAARLLKNKEKRIIYIANSHASIASLTSADELGIPLEELGEVENAEGLRLDFYSSGNQRTAKPVGEKIESLNKNYKKS